MPIANVAISTPTVTAHLEWLCSSMGASHSEVVAVVAVSTVVVARPACVSDKKVLTLRHRRALRRSMTRLVVAPSAGVRKCGRACCQPNLLWRKLIRIDRRTAAIQARVVAGNTTVHQEPVGSGRVPASSICPMMIHHSGRPADIVIGGSRAASRMIFGVGVQPGGAG
jgi:hypothetical protein